MSKLTQEQKELYIDRRGNACPYCGSGNIVAVEQLDALDGSAWQECRCRDCNQNWRDVYTLTEVEEVEAEE